VRTLRRCVVAFALMASLSLAAPEPGWARENAPNWVTAWGASVQGPYPSGYPSAQPNMSFAFPDPATGARDQSFRLVVRPDVWGPQARLRFSNAFGTRPVTFDNVYAGEYAIAGTLIPGTNRPVRFGGASSVTIPPGQSVWSDAVGLSFVHAASDPALLGRKLAVSFHIAGESGPMTWHAKALTTSYVTRPGAGATGAIETDAPFTYATASWYFLDAVDMAMPTGTRLIVVLADSITDGTDSTMNGDDRWPDQFSRRLHAMYGTGVAIVNEGIGGNRIIGPATYTAAQPFAGGPSAQARLERDVLTLSGVSTVVIFDGINDFGKAGEGATVEAVEAGLADIVTRTRAKLPGARIIGTTLTTALGSSNKDHGSPAEDVNRRAFNDFIRSAKMFDGVLDFDRVTLDPQTGEMKAEFVPDNTVGGPGDKLHPNRAGYAALANSIDLRLFAP
jgi:lysophospholipase L1-like esterase